MEDINAALQRIRSEALEAKNTIELTDYAYTAYVFEDIENLIKAIEFLMGELSIDSDGYCEMPGVGKTQREKLSKILHPIQPPSEPEA